MQNLSDRDIGYDILYGTKSAAMEYMAAVLESSSPRCREIFHRLHDDALRSQWKVWQFLHQRQEYRTAEAHPQEVDGVRQRMAHLCRTHNIGGQQPVGVGADTTGFQAEGARGGHGGQGHWGDGREGGRWDEREGRWSEAGAGYGRQGTHGLAGSTYGGATTGNYAATGSSAGINFEPDRNMPEGTRFESDRGFAEGSMGNAMTGSAFGPGAGAAGATGYGTQAGGFGAAGATFSGTGTSYGSGTGGQWNESSPRAGVNPGAGANASAQWNDRDAGRTAGGSRVGGSIGARPSESSRRNFGESTWSSEEVRKSGRY